MNLYEQAATALFIMAFVGFVLIVRIYLRFRRESR